MFIGPPGSQSLIAFQTKLAPERFVKIVSSAPTGGLRPKIISYPYLKPGDEIPQATVRLFDLANQSEIRVNNDLFGNPFSLQFERWSRDGKKCYLAYNERGHQTLRLIEIDVETGSTRAVIEERSDTFIHYSGKYELHWLGDDEVVWMSERDGWNHLYLIDVATGDVKTQLTRGPWNVRRVLRYDTEARAVFFEAVGVAGGQSPYHVHLCRVDLDGSDFVQLSRGDGTHEIQWSPNQARFIDRWSRVDLPPVSVLRNAKTGELVCELERANVEKVVARNGPLPERFVAKGRDGKTDIWGIIHRPSDFDPMGKYPVIESIYAGPHDHHVPVAYRSRHGVRRLVDRGFIVVQIDGMGTAWRSKAFHDVCWKNLRDAGFPDRIAWMRAAEAEYPELDLKRVGVIGGSAGGQNAMGALLWHGDFYKVAVADCGCHDNRMDKIWWNEQWMGWPVGKEYAENSNVENAHLLQGKLLLIVGELDKNVDPASTTQVVDALVKAEKEFEFLLVPGPATALPDILTPGES